MKCQYIIGASLSLFALALLSCAKQEVQTDTDSIARAETQDRVLVPMCFGAESEASEEKATISGTSINWEAEDNVAVFDDKTPGIINRFFVTSGAGSTSATLSGTVTSGSTSFCAVLPADAAVSREGTMVSVTVPDTQVISAGKCVDASALVCVAYSASTSLSFKNVCGFIQVTLSRADVTQIEVEGANLAGTATVTASTGELVTDGVTDGKNVVSLTYAGGEAFPAGTYYIAVLPGTSSDFTLRMLTASAFGRRTAEDVSIARKNYYATSNSAVSFGSGNLILNAAALVSWSGTASSASDIVALGADIDMSGQAWTPKNFAGVFEGRGKTIRNFSGSASFVQDNSGTIKDLTIDGTMTPATGNAPIYFGVIAAKNDGGTIANCTNNASVIRTFDANSTFNYGMAYAGVVGYNAGTLTGCVNHGEIKVEQTYDSGTPANNKPLKSTVLGGIAAYSSSDISGCVNTGTIIRIVNGHKGSISSTLPVSQETVDPCLGGIVGLVYKATVSDCRNSGVIRCLENYLPCMSEGAWTSLGGIAGAVEGEVTGCVNSGPLQMETFNEGETNGTPYTSRMYVPYLGGIVGSSVYSAMNANSKKDNLQVSNCSSSSDISVSHCGTTTYGAVGGIVGWPCGEGIIENTSITSCTNTGSIYEYGCSRIRLGGILGGSGPAEDCHFTGDITSYHKNGLTAEDGTSSHVNIGGICGINQFKTGNDIVNCTVGNDADGTTIRYNLTDEDGNATIPANACFYGIGGLVGQAYTPTVEDHVVFKGCSLKCAIYSNHPKDIGLLVGQFASTGYNDSLHFGSSGNEITIRNGSLVSFSRPLSSGAAYTTTEIVADATNVNTPLGESCSTWYWDGRDSGSIKYGDSVTMGFLTGSESSSVASADFSHIVFSKN